MLRSMNSKYHTHACVYVHIPTLVTSGVCQGAKCSKNAHKGKESNT